MKIPINISSIYGKAKQNVSVVLLAALIILLLMEAWTIKGSWAVLAASKDATLIVPPRLVRINFTVYDSIVKRVENSAAYDPKPFIYRNPFGYTDKTTKP